MLCKLGKENSWNARLREKELDYHGQHQQSTESARLYDTEYLQYLETNDKGDACMVVSHGETLPSPSQCGILKASR